MKKKMANGLNQSWIVTHDEPRLHEISKSDSIEFTPEENELIKKMQIYIDISYERKDQVYNIRPGIAIAGPQVGLYRRVIYINFDDGDCHYRYLLANPKIVAESVAYSYIPNGEGCLSVPRDVKGVVPRKAKIIVEAYDLLAKSEIELECSGIFSICMQHEIDHLNGKLYYDRIKKEDPNHFSEDWIKIL